MTTPQHIGVRVANLQIPQQTVITKRILSKEIINFLNADTIKTKKQLFRFKRVTTPVTPHSTKITCPICLEESTNDAIQIVGCKHKFHSKCLRTWVLVKEKWRCPLCRYEL